MKYSDSDIVLVKSDNIYKYKYFIPSNNEYMFLKILSTGRILLSKGTYLKSLFKLKHSLEEKNLIDIKIEFFNDYLYNIIEKIKQDHTAYQFSFQYKDKLDMFTCSVYPCLVYDECKSFDVIVRNNTKTRDSEMFFLKL